MAASNPDTPSYGPLRGVWTALATPFRTDLQIDWDAFDKLLDHQEKGGVTGIVISGTTGESPTLSVQEKLSMIRKARAKLSPKIRVMAGTGDNNTQQSLELSRLAQDAGADSLLVVTPPYNKPSTAGLVAHYKAIATSVKIPVCLYHVPGRTAHFLTVDQIAQVCKEGHVQGVKEASGDLAFFTRAKNKSGGVPYLSGDDPTYLASLAVGGAGVTSVVSNVFPGAVVELYNAATKGDMARAQKLNDILMPAIDALLCEVNPCPLKAALEILGLAKNTLRPPLAPVVEANYRRIQEVVQSTAAALKR